MQPLLVRQASCCFRVFDHIFLAPTTVCAFDSFSQAMESLRLLVRQDHVSTVQVACGIRKASTPGCAFLPRLLACVACLPPFGGAAVSPHAMLLQCDSTG